MRDLARATVAACSLAAAQLLATRNDTRLPDVEVDEEAVATAFVSERHLRIDGRTPVSFAPHSGFFRTADGWVRTHANYPHHRARLLAALGLPAEADAARLAAELATRAAVDVQETAYAADALAVAVAPVDPAREPLPLVETLAGGPTDRSLAAAPLPAAGVRVLDLTRVIAGPVATRTLALLGADVLRLDAPHLPESEDAQADTGFGKRSARLDLADRAALDGLLAEADVVITGYRPHALDRFGLSPDALAERHPGLITAQLCAWGWTGPWADRRGFDSLVQAGRGIADLESAPDGTPCALPAQALDHGTGYLLAAAVLHALTQRQLNGRGTRLRLSLAGTADWLIGLPRTDGAGPDAEQGRTPDRWLTETPSPYGLLRHARPPIGYAGAPATWTRGPSRWGTDRPSWT